MRNRITLEPEHESPLFYKNSKIKIADDAYGGKARLGCHYRGEPQLEFLQTFRSAPYTLVDIGANVGLFSRQALVTAPELAQRVFAYEPDAENYADCLYNLNPWHHTGKISVNRVALGDQEMSVALYRDFDNCGNYSQLISAMPDEHFDNVKVTMRRISVESKRWTAASLPIFYKSDVQGMDEVLATHLDPQFWKRNCFAALIEVWRIEGKAKLDTYKFRQILSCFNKRVFSRHPEKFLSEDDIFEYLASGHARFDHDDLMLWKAS